MKNWSQQYPTPRNMSQHVTTGWPGECNMLLSTMLLYVALKCYNRLAGAQQQLHIYMWRHVFEKTFLNNKLLSKTYRIVGAIMGEKTSSELTYILLKDIFVIVF